MTRKFYFLSSLFARSTSVQAEFSCSELPHLWPFRVSVSHGALRSDATCVDGLSAEGRGADAEGQESRPESRREFEILADGTEQRKHSDCKLSFLSFKFNRLNPNTVFGRDRCFANSLQW